jgi:hypothetical protein
MIDLRFIRQKTDRSDRVNYVSVRSKVPLISMANNQLALPLLD